MPEQSIDPTSWIKQDTKNAEKRVGSHECGILWSQNGSQKG